MDGDGVAVGVLEDERAPNGVSKGSVRMGTPWPLRWSCSAWASSARSDSETPRPGGPASRSVPGRGSRTANGMGEVWKATTPRWRAGCPLQAQLALVEGGCAV
jgi:hypothetical protein